MQGILDVAQARPAVSTLDVKPVGNVLGGLDVTTAPRRDI